MADLEGKLAEIVERLENRNIENRNIILYEDTWAAIREAAALGRAKGIDAALEALNGECYGHDTGGLYQRIYEVIHALKKEKR